jgi:hypothetical protein
MSTLEGKKTYREMRFDELHLDMHAVLRHAGMPASNEIVIRNIHGDTCEYAKYQDVFKAGDKTPRTETFTREDMDQGLTIKVAR